MKVRGGAPVGGDFAGIQCAHSTANITEKASLPYVVIRRVSRYLAGLLLSILSRIPMNRRLQWRNLFSVSSWCECSCCICLCISSVACCRGCKMSSAVPTRVFSLCNSNLKFRQILVEKRNIDLDFVNFSSEGALERGYSIQHLIHG